MIYIAGIDTLHYGFYVKSFSLAKEEWENLKRHKEAAQAGMFISDGWPITFRGYRFKILPKGTKQYTYILVSDDMSVKIARRPSNKMFPEVFVEFRSQLLWRYGYMEAFRLIKAWVRSWAWGFDEVISRVDPCLDISGKHQVEIEHLVSRARKEHEFLGLLPIQDAEYYWYNKKRTGIIIGSGKCLGRIYDKTAEVKKSNKGWFHDLWKEKGWDGGSTVTRVEVQLRREFLRDFGITNFEDFIKKMPDIFSYLVEEWVTVRTPTDDINRSRWPVSDFWQEVQGGLSLFGVKHGNLTKRPIKEAKLERLLPQAAGVITSAMSLMESGKSEELLDLVAKYLAKNKGMSLEEATEAKRKLRGMFGSPEVEEPTEI